MHEYFGSTLHGFLRQYVICQFIDLRASDLLLRREKMGLLPYTLANSHWFVQLSRLKRGQKM